MQSSAIDLKKEQTKLARRALLEAARKSASLKVTPGPSAARSQDFLYDEEGVFEALKP
jgi:hypothetical protein